MEGKVSLLPEGEEMPFYIILIMCLFGGLIIVFLATWLTTTRGNTISEILNSQKLKDAEAIRVEIADKIKISSTIPVVALYLVGASVAIGLPALIYWVDSREVASITLSGNVLKEQRKKVFMRPKDMSIEESGHFDIPVYMSKRTQTINIESEYYAPLTMSVEIDKSNNLIKVFFSNSTHLKEEEHKLDVGVWNIRLRQDISLFPATVPSPENRPSTPEAPSAPAPVASAEYLPFTPGGR
jgi:hypothetical protein